MRLGDARARPIAWPAAPEEGNVTSNSEPSDIKPKEVDSRGAEAEPAPTSEIRPKPGDTRGGSIDPTTGIRPKPRETLGGRIGSRRDLRADPRPGIAAGGRTKRRAAPGS